MKYGVLAPKINGRFMNDAYHDGIISWLPIKCQHGACHKRMNLCLKSNVILSKPHIINKSILTLKHGSTYT